MVLDAGHIVCTFVVAMASQLLTVFQVEFDSPKELLKIKDGKLRSLVDESADKDTLIEMANA